MPTWLSLMSPNSKSWTVSNSTAKTWLVALPTSLALRSPRYWLGSAPASSLEVAMVKARPWPPSFGYSGTMAKANAVEKENTAPSVPFLKRRDVG
ncbi:hypothetical protein ACMD2_23264 [Ananas comosus]|uniref:Uncharacterized protein n=1 Tax=Ananas comosus TaxID=4615 RepID=A0A199V3P0_ANACO|nr:hypothetical protein ACMD2_23264 [Ananas comosus]